MDPRRRLNFRRCLNSISNQLSRQSLEDMKFVCKDHVPVSRMERVRSAVDLFQALEERGKMSANDTNFLAQVLVSVDRNNLVSDLKNAGFGPSVPPQPLQHSLMGVQPDGPQPSAEFLFNETLLKIAQHLSAKDVETLTYTWAEPLLQISVDRVTSGTHLFQLLQQRQLVTPTDLRMLFDELQVIGRSDLCKRINSYLSMTGQRPYNFEEAEGYVQPAAGANHMTHPTEESHPSYLPQPPQSLPPHPSTLPPDHDRFTGHRTSESGQPISTPSDASSSSTMVHPSGSYFSGLSSGLPSASSSTFTGDRLQGSTAEHDVRFGGGAVPSAPTAHVPPNYRPPEPCSNFVPEYTYPIGPVSGLSVEESGGSQPSLQPGPYNLTFPPNEEEPEDEESQHRLTRVEVQDLQTRWSQSQEQLQAVELEKQQLQAQLEQLREQNDRIMAERIGESEQYQTNNRELEAALQRKIEEVQSLQEEMKLIQQNLQPTRPVPDVNPDELYKLEKNPHGICLIINNHKFYHKDPQKAHPQRGGAEIDQYNLTQTFRYLRYKVEVEENLTSDEMTDRLLKMSQRDHSRYDSFVCCILSHGEHNIIHGANSEPVNINDLTGLMKYSVSLRNKPKLFFIQCCRGEDEDVGFEKDNPGDGSSFRSTIPQEADFFLGFATPLGKAAYRSRKHGSWFISELCKVFTQYGYHSTLSSMMRRVNRQVSNAFTKDGYKQCTEFVDRLRREVHFFYFIRNRGKSS